MEDDTNTGTRGPPKDVSDDELAEVVEELGRATTAEVNKRLPKEFDHAHLIRRLKSLVDSGEIVNYRPSREHNWLSYEEFHRSSKAFKFKDAIKEQDGDIASTEDVAEETGYDELATLEKLRRMEREGEVVSKGTRDVGDLVWTVNE